MLYTVDYQTLIAKTWQPGTEPDKNCAIVSAKTPEEAAEFAARRYRPLEIAKKEVPPYPVRRLTDTYTSKEYLDLHHKKLVAERLTGSQVAADAAKLSDSLEQMVSALKDRPAPAGGKRITVDREKLEECFALADWIATALSDSSA